MIHTLNAQVRQFPPFSRSGSLVSESATGACLSESSAKASDYSHAARNRGAMHPTIAGWSFHSNERSLRTNPPSTHVNETQSTPSTQRRSSSSSAGPVKQPGSGLPLSPGRRQHGNDRRYTPHDRHGERLEAWYGHAHRFASTHFFRIFCLL